MYICVKERERESEREREAGRKGERRKGPRSGEAVHCQAVVRCLVVVVAGGEGRGVPGRGGGIGKERRAVSQGLCTI